MTDIINAYAWVTRADAEKKELLANIVLAFDTGDQMALEGFITQADELVNGKRAVEE